MISKAASYAVQSLAYLAIESSSREYVPIKEIAEKLSIPYYFLKKVLAELVTGGLLISYRSAKGGIALARSVDQISLLDIITMVDGDVVFRECILGLPGCGEKTPCVLHETWSLERKRLYKMFNDATLKTVAKKINEQGFRIAP